VKLKLVKRMSVEGSLLFLDDGVATVDPKRDRKGKDLSIELLLAFDQSEKFDNRSHRKGESIDTVICCH